MSEFITKVVIAADNQTAPAVTAATKGIQNYAKAATAAQSQVRGASRQSRAALQQLGYQVQDISVQLQAGQSPFIVLAQQGSQVASIFGPGGAVLGALIAVGGAIAGNLLPSLFKTSESLAEIKKRAEALGVKFEDIAPVSAAKNLSDLQKELQSTREQIKSYGGDIDEVKAKIQSTKQLPLGALNEALSKQNIDETRISIEALLIKEKELNEEILKGQVMSGSQAQQAALDIQNSFKERQAEIQAEINELLRAAESPLATLQRRTQELLAKEKELGLGKEWLISMLEKEGKIYEASLPKKEKATDLVDKEAKAYENLKRALDPAYGAYQSYYETVTQINNSADTQANKITLISVAYAKLYESLGLVANQQDKVKHKIEQTTEKVDPTPLEKYKDSIKSVDWSMEQMAANGLKSMEDGLTNFIMGTGNAADAFKSMARSIVSDLIRMQIQQSITGPLSGLLQGMSLFGGAPMTGSAGTPGVSSVGGPIAPVPSFSGGGYTGAGGRTGGLDGKGGFMAMVHPNETVVDHTKGGNGAGVTVVQNINVTTGVQQTVRTEIASLMPQIAAASKQAVLDARKRGGSFGAAFGA